MLIYSQLLILSHIFGRSVRKGGSRGFGRTPLSAVHGISKGSAHAYGHGRSTGAYTELAKAGWMAQGFMAQVRGSAIVHA